VAGSELTAARPGGLRQRWLTGLSAWRVSWSVPAAWRAARATIVVPGLFALTYKVVGDPQMALFAVFGGFASLVMASFAGTRRDKLIAHLGLAVAGSVALTIGTLVSGTAWLAALVTIPVAFAIFFAGVAGPNAASAVTPTLLIYVLPVASAGGMSTVPSRLEGWWLAAAVSTAAVLLLSPKTPADRLRAAAASTARTLADELDAASRQAATAAQRAASITAKHDLMTQFGATPYRPTGLATSEQALDSMVQALEWCTSLAADALDGHLNLDLAAPADLDLMALTAGVLRDAAALLSGQDVRLDLDRVESARAASADYQRNLSGDPDQARVCAKIAFHAQVIAVAARAVAADALIVAGRASPDLIDVQRREWFGVRPEDPPPGHGIPLVGGAVGFISQHASFRSVWTLNSLRGAVGLAAAVAVADMTGVQHGFWVVLGTLSVLRTSAAATGSTAWRALAGTVLGFVVGAALLLGIGTGQTALWVALPVAVLVAAYTPGTAPFVFGQAAFTITVVVLFNLLVPVGWKVGLLRVQDVALGCAVSLIVGVLFWPRGAAPVVGDDLADAFRRGSSYLTQAVDWALGVRGRAPDTASAAVSAGTRLDDALRGYLAEQGSKKLAKEDLWLLVTSTMRLRFTAYSLASLRGLDVPAYPDAPEHIDAGRLMLRQSAAELVGFYERVATQMARPPHGSPAPEELVAPYEEMHTPNRDGATVHHHPQNLWVREHLHHLRQHVASLPEPALHVAEVRRTPWWR
jgi:uncharacterized membrane protein YccC